MATRYIHGGTDPVETARLEKQARFLSRWILEGVEAGPGARVLDLACGVGAMSRRLRARLPDAHIIGCDLSLSQLRAARSFPALPGDQTPLVNCDAAALPFRSGSFDTVHWSWLLEHVPRGATVRILGEVRRLLAPGGRAWMCEVENDSLAFWPRLPLVEDCFRALWESQERGGGDPIVGRKLHGLCTEAGFTKVQLIPTTIHVHGGSPFGLFRGALEEFAEVLLSARESLPAPLAVRADDAARQLLGLETVAGGSFTYTCFRARAEG